MHANKRYQIDTYPLPPETLLTPPNSKSWKDTGRIGDTFIYLTTAMASQPERNWRYLKSWSPTATPSLCHETDGWGTPEERHRSITLWSCITWYSVSDSSIDAGTNHTHTWAHRCALPIQVTLERTISYFTRQHKPKKFNDNEWNS